MGRSRFWNLAMKEETAGRVGWVARQAVGIGRGPLLLLSVVASITVEIDSTRHQSEFIHWVGHFWDALLAIYTQIRLVLT